MSISDYRVKIKELPEEIRPRERLLKDGPEALTTAELLAVLLRTGTSSMSALDLSSYLLSKSGGLLGLIDYSSEELCSIKGVGPAKAAQLKAAVELGRRLASEVKGPRKIIRSSSDVYSLLKERMRYYDKEYFNAVFLNTKNHVIDIETISIGSLNSSLVHPRELFKAAVKKSAASMVLVHNHPSGDPAPSQEDINITRRLVEAGNIIGILVLDHLIIGDNCYVSFKDQGII